MTEKSGNESKKQSPQKQIRTDYQSPSISNENSDVEMMRRAIENPTQANLNPKVVMQLQRAYGNQFTLGLVNRARQPASADSTKISPSGSLNTSIQRGGNDTKKAGKKPVAKPKGKEKEKPKEEPVEEYSGYGSDYSGYGSGYSDYGSEYSGYGTDEYSDDPEEEEGKPRVPPSVVKPGDAVKVGEGMAELHSISDTMSQMEEKKAEEENPEPKPDLMDRMTAILDTWQTSIPSLAVAGAQKLSGPIGGAAKAGMDLKKMREYYHAYKQASVRPSEGVAQNASFAVKKTFRGYVTRVFRFALAVGKAISAILAIVTFGATLVVSLALALIGVADKALHWARGLYKIARGTRGKERWRNAKELVEAGLQKDEDALDLLMDLSLTGTGWKIKNSIKDWIVGKVKTRSPEEQVVLDRIAAVDIKTEDDMHQFLFDLNTVNKLDGFIGAVSNTMKSQ